MWRGSISIGKSISSTSFLSLFPIQDPCRYGAGIHRFPVLVEFHLPSPSRSRHCMVWIFGNWNGIQVLCVIKVISVPGFSFCSSQMKGRSQCPDHKLRNRLKPIRYLDIVTIIRDCSHLPLPTEKHGMMNPLSPFSRISGASSQGPYQK